MLNEVGLLLVVGSRNSSNSNRLVEVARSRSLRLGLYGVSQVISGAVFAAVGRQIRNPLLRHDAWAGYVPLGRFREVVEKEGFVVDTIEIDFPRRKVTSIDAWLRRI
jgi:hypothetical protein